MKLSSLQTVILVLCAHIAYALPVPLDAQTQVNVAQIHDNVALLAQTNRAQTSDNVAPTAVQGNVAAVVDNVAGVQQDSKAVVGGNVAALQENSGGVSGNQLVGLAIESSSASGAPFLTSATGGAATTESQRNGTEAGVATDPPSTVETKTANVSGNVATQQQNNAIVQEIHNATGTVIGSQLNHLETHHVNLTQNEFQYSNTTVQNTAIQQDTIHNVHNVYNQQQQQQFIVHQHLYSGERVVERLVEGQKEFVGERSGRVFPKEEVESIVVPNSTYGTERSQTRDDVVPAYTELVAALRKELDRAQKILELLEDH